MVGAVMRKVPVCAPRPDVQDKRLRRLITRSQLRRRVKELAVEIKGDYAGQRPLLVAVLKGTFVLLADLVRALGIPLEVDFITVSSYGTGTKSKGHVTILHDLTVEVAGRHVLMVEDIIDSGLTLGVIRRHITARQPADLRVCALLARESALIAGVNIDYLGFPVPEGFVVGYGIDYAQQYRQLPDIYVLEEA
jgi:hypoxanthine phosphoribosyltransferase